MNAVVVNREGNREASGGTAVAVPEFWYSKRSAVAITALLLILAQTFSLLIPPFQSPDEPNHIKRAYLLSRGKFLLGSEKGVTGGNIDTGLLDYIGLFDALKYQYNSKVTSSTVRASSRIEWSGKEAFSTLPNTACYFPLPYLPQAIAFSIGKRSGLTIQESYYLARTLSLLATLALILAALFVYPMPLMVLAIFVTPMSLFQFGSASLDSVSFGLSALTGALFIRAAAQKLSFGRGMHASLVLCIFCLATSRIALFPLTAILAFLYIARRSRSYLVSSAGLIFLSATWILYALATVKGLDARTLSTTDTINYYLARPFAFIHVFFATVTNEDVLTWYWRTFVGVLGWADTPLGSNVYLGFGVLFALLGIFSLQRKPVVSLKNGGVQLACAAIGSVFLMYFIFLVTFEDHPAKIIQGIGGRYFIPIFILLTYSLFNRRLRPYEWRLGTALVATMIILSIAGAIPRLLGRYWMN